MKKKLFLLLVAVIATVAETWAQSYTEVSSFDALKTALEAGQNVRLTSDIPCTSAISISARVIIDGNGKKLTGSSSRAFSVGSSGVLSVKNLTVTGFSLSGGGGAFVNNGTLVLEDCTVSGNHTEGGSYGGGAIENKKKLYAFNTTFSGNYSGEIGGAINNYGGDLYLSECTFSNNYTTSSNAKYGGAIGINGGSEIRIINCTFSGNKYNTDGGASDLGIYSNSSAYTIAGCSGITIQSSSAMTTYELGVAELNSSDLSNISFLYTPSNDAITLTNGKEGTVTGEYWLTYYNASHAFTADANTKIYKGKLNGGSLTLTEVTDIAAGQAVILKSTSASVTLTLATSASSNFSGNDLKGGTTITSGNDAYTLSRGNAGTGAVGFYKYSGVLKGSKAHLEMPASTSRSFIDINDETTGVIELKDGKTEDGKSLDSWYSLDGRRLNGKPAQKGIYVKNGKKFIIK